MKRLPSQSLMEENYIFSLTPGMDSVNESSPSVMELTQALTEYKIGIYLFTYMTVPVAVWGWMGNFLSFRVMMLPCNQKTSVNVFLAALACSDSLHLLFTVHIWLLAVTEYRSDWMCKVLFWYGLVARCSSYAFIIIVTLQRCVAIALPLKRMEWMSVESAKTKIIPFVVIFNIAYNSYTVFLLTEADPGIFGCNPFGGKPEIARIGTMLTLVIDIFVPFTTISILNAILIRAIRQRNRDLEAFDADPKRSAAEKQRKSQEGRQLTLSLILVCGAFLVLASPIFTLMTIFTFVDPLASPRRFANFNLMRGIFEQILHINAGINFWLYCVAGKTFRDDLKSLFCRHSSQNLDNNSSSTTPISTSRIE